MLFKTKGSEQRTKLHPAFILSLGTFLEYFDLNLYIHMAVLLDEIFMPKSAPETQPFIIALSFCSTYLLRPFGAIIFGYISDNYGRKTTVIISTTLMSLCCLVMANVPTYTQVGIAATLIVTICRVVQGMSSMGEFISSQIYLTETTTPPKGYVYVSLLSFATALGVFAALGFATMLTQYGFSWRIAFWGGAVIAVISSAVRTRLAETLDFTKVLQTGGVYKTTTKMNVWKIFKVGFKGLKFEGMPSDFCLKRTLSMFFISCSWPFTFYLVFIYFIPVLKGLGCTSQDIIKHNFILSLVGLPVIFGLSLLSYRVNPLKILKVRACMFVALMLFFPYLLDSCTTPAQLLCFQCVFWSFDLEHPAKYIYFKTIPTYRRVTTSSLLYALSRIVVYITTAFGLAYLTKWFGSFGPSILGLPLAVCGLLSVNHFLKLQKDQTEQRLEGQELAKPMVGRV